MRGVEGEVAAGAGCCLINRQKIPVMNARLYDCVLYSPQFCCLVKASWRPSEYKRYLQSCLSFLYAAVHIEQTAWLQHVFTVVLDSPHYLF